MSKGGGHGTCSRLRTRATCTQTPPRTWVALRDISSGEIGGISPPFPPWPGMAAHAGGCRTCCRARTCHIAGLFHARGGVCRPSGAKPPTGMPGPAVCTNSLIAKVTSLPRALPPSTRSPLPVNPYNHTSTIPSHVPICNSFLPPHHPPIHLSASSPTPRSHSHIPHPRRDQPALCHVSQLREMYNWNRVAERTEAVYSTVVSVGLQQP